MSRSIHAPWPADEPPSDKPRLLKQLDAPEAHDLAEMYVIRDCLREAYSSMSLYFHSYSEAEEGSDEYIIRLSLFRDAIVQFYECFAAPKKPEKIRPTFEEVYDRLPHIKHWRETEKWFYTTRHGWAAHNFGAQRQYDICAILEWNDAHDRVRFVGVADAAVNFKGLNKVEYRRILQMMMEAVHFMDVRIETNQLALRKGLAAADADTLFQLPDYVLAPPRLEQDRPISRKEARRLREEQPQPSAARRAAETAAPATSPPSDSDPPVRDPDDEARPPTR